MTKLFCTSSHAGLALLAAAIEAGRFGAGRMVLLVANEAVTPEAVPGPWDVPGFDALVADYNEVVRLNDLIAPLHPHTWLPPQPELPLLSRLMTQRLAGGDVIDELVVESVIAGPGTALVQLIPDAAITLACPTLTPYGPAVPDAPSEIGGRVTRLVHLDLLPGITPALRYHPGMSTEAVAVADVRAALGAGAGGGGGDANAGFDALLLDERYAERGLLPAAQERAVHVAAIRALAAGGHRRILFAPHPEAVPGDVSELSAAARAASAQLTVGPASVSHEALAAHTPALVVGIAAPALFIAARAATTGAGAVLERQSRPHQLERMPLAIANAALPRLEVDGSLAPPRGDLAGEIDAVARRLTNPGPIHVAPVSGVRRIGRKARSILARE